MCISENLEHTHLSDRAVVLQAGCLCRTSGAVSGYSGLIIFSIPPYQQEYDRKVLELLQRCHAFVTDDTLIVRWRPPTQLLLIMAYAGFCGGEEQTVQDK